MSELSQAEKELILRKHERTMKLRAEFLKQSSNPHRHSAGHGGQLFDTGLARFQAMRVSHYEHFKPNAKTFRVGALCLLLPIALYSWALKSERDGREALYRTGQVAYKDRRFKFI